MSRIFLFICLFFTVNESLNLAISAQNNCAGIPQFIEQLGFNPQEKALSTSSKGNRGLVLIDVRNPRAEIYQAESWDDAGFLGRISRNEYGDCFLIPVPTVNTLHNPPEKQNIIYKVDSKNGEMSPFLELPIPNPPHERNPFGLLGLEYDCETTNLFASSVMGSDRNKEVGIVYSINAADGKIVDRLEGMDVLGLFPLRVNGKKRLLLGSARSSAIFMIDLLADGSFEGKPSLFLSLEGLGPRGDDRVRRIKLARDGSLKIHGIEFHFNLIAPTEKQESVYSFRLDPKSKQWIYLGWE